MKTLILHYVLSAIVFLSPVLPAIVLAIDFNPGDTTMSDNPNPEPSQNAERRLEPFMDCLAFLLAKRWLREQRQSEEKPPQNQPEPQEDQPKE